MTVPAPPPGSGTRLLSFRQLDQRSDAFDDAVMRSPNNVDYFCSSTDWVLPARTAFARGARPVVLECAAGFVALMSLPLAEGGFGLLPLEASWGLACPFAGADSDALVAALFDVVGQHDPVAHALFLSGLPIRGAVERAIHREAGRRGWISGTSATAGRSMACLRGGLDGFLSRRSPGFRAKARRERRIAAREGLTYEFCDDAPTETVALDLYERIQSVERRCWKGLTGNGIDGDPAFTFYRSMILRLAARGRLRLVFARQNDQDIAYVFGGVMGGFYRGLQVSFDDAARRLAPGVLVHLEMIERLSAEGVAVYDLGSEMEYKKRWGEREMTTHTVVVMRTF